MPEFNNYNPAVHAQQHTLHTQHCSLHSLPVVRQSFCEHMVGKMPQGLGIVKKKSWYHSCLVDFGGSIPTCAWFCSETFFLCFYITHYKDEGNTLKAIST